MKILPMIEKHISVIDHSENTYDNIAAISFNTKAPHRYLIEFSLLSMFVIKIIPLIYIALVANPYANMAR